LGWENQPGAGDWPFAWANGFVLANGDVILLVSGMLVWGVLVWGVLVLV
jgi:hypothetical protein